MFKEDPILDNSLNTLEETKLLPSGMEDPVEEPTDKISQNAADLTLVDLKTMTLAEATNTLAAMPVGEILQRWEGTPPEMKQELALELRQVIGLAMTRMTESNPKKAKKKKGKK